MKRSTLLVTAALVGACSAPPRPTLQRQDILESLTGTPLLAEVGPPSAPSGPAEPEEAAPRWPRIAGDEVYALQLRGVALPEAFHLIAAHAGVNLYLDANLRGHVDAEFPAVTLDDALYALLARHGMRLVEEPAGIFFVELADGSQPAMAEFQLESTAAVDVLDELTALIGGDAVVVADATHNFVVVRGTQESVDVAEAYLERVDRLQPQVLVEVHVFEVTLDDRFELGMDAAFTGTVQNGAVEVLTNLGAPSPFTVNLSDSGGDFDATIDAIQSYVDLELVSSPRVLAVTNSEAKIEVIEEIPYVETTTVTSGTTGGVGSTTQESVEFKEAGITMIVTPTIQEDGTLMIHLDQKLSEVAEFFNDIPVLDTRSLVTRFLIRDGETVVLGGLMQDRRQDRNTGVPILMHVPILGHLFRGDEDTTVKRELLVFVTPRILDPSQASRLAPSYQDHFRESRRRMLDGK